MLISVKLLTKYVIITYATEGFGVWIKAVPLRSKGEIPGRASRRKEWMSRSKLKQAFQIDSDAELFMYLIQSRENEHSIVLGSAQEKFGIWTGPKTLGNLR